MDQQTYERLIDYLSDSAPNLAPWEETEAELRSDGFANDETLANMKFQENFYESVFNLYIELLKVEHGEDIAERIKQGAIEHREVRRQRGDILIRGIRVRPRI